MKLSSIARRLLDKKYRTLFNAGYVQDDLSISNKGMNRLLAILAEGNMEAWLESAEQDIKEDKESAE